MQVLAVDLAAGMAWPGHASAPAHVLFTWGRLPLGARNFATSQLPPSTATMRQIAADFGAMQLAARDREWGAIPSVKKDGELLRRARPIGGVDAATARERLDCLARPAQVDGAAFTLIVCTRDRLDDLPTCLAQIAALDPAPAETIIVDNALDGTARSLVTAYPALRYVHEPRPGLSRARNAGIRAAQGSLIAFTDDDAWPAQGWIGELARAFADHDVAAVTGLVAPSELETEAQQLFQFMLGGFGRVYEPTVFDHDFYLAGRPHGVPVWRIGAGANMAFRREAFEEVGLFDERLGAGASGCSEDSELWYRLLAAGARILYEPRAIVHHRHRRDIAGLRRQVRAYSRGHVAALIAQADRYGDPGNLRRMFRLLPAYYLGTFIIALVQWQPRRLMLVFDEARGWLTGITYVLRRRWRRSADVPVLPEVHHG